MKRTTIPFISALAMCLLLLISFGTGHAMADNHWQSHSESLSAQADTSLSPFTDIESLTEAQAKTLGASPAVYAKSQSTSGVKVKSRDWSKYTNARAKLKLNRAERALYDRLDSVCQAYLQQPGNHLVKGDNIYVPQQINYTDLGLTADQADNVCSWFRANNPQYFFYRGTAHSGSALLISINVFLANLDEAAVTNAMFDKLDNWIASCSAAGQTTWDKVCAINRKLCESTEYSSEVREEGNEFVTPESQSLYSILMTPDSVCVGYAAAFCAMANAMGVDAYTVQGDGHQWNVVRFDNGFYYIVDVCWNDTNPESSYRFVGVGTDYLNYGHEYAPECIAYAPKIPSSSYHGYGRMVFSDGTVYEGGWLNGKRNGFGKQKTSDGTYYECEWYNDVPSGFGKVRYASGGCYEGNWKDGKHNGFGMYTWSNGDVYIGEFSGSKMTGYGALKRTSGDVTAGTWKDGNLVERSKQEITKLTYTSASYIGQVADGKPYGYGWMDYNSGGFYEGIWMYGKQHCFGQLMNASGDVYKGIWSEGKRCGHGKYSWTNGNIYVGTSGDSLKSGRGTLLWSDGSIYDGAWKNDKQNGYGWKKYSDGSTYEGEWQDSKRVGQGVFTFTDGRRYKGEWQGNKQNGQGTCTWPSGAVFTGSWKDGMPVSGTMTNASGKSMIGHWDGSKFVPDNA